MTILHQKPLAAPCGCQLCEITPGECNLITVHEDGKKERCMNSTMIGDGISGYGDSCDLSECSLVSVEETPVEKIIKSPEVIAEEVFENPEVIGESLDAIFSNPSTEGVIGGDTDGEGYEQFVENVQAVESALDIVAEAVADNPVASEKIANAQRLLQLLKDIGESKA